MIQKIVVPYEHDPADLQRIDLAVVIGRAVPKDQDWKPALRDTVDGKRVVWTKADVPQNASVWIRDRNGVRRVPRWTAGTGRP